MRTLILAACLSLAGCAHNTPAPESSTAAPALTAAAAQAIVDAPDRTEADKAIDAGRQPAALLQFVGVGPGMKVAELMAGGGYTTELLARAVGPTGTVYGQNPKFVLERFAEKPWSERLARPVNAKVVRADREFDEPLPPEVTDLDAVVSHAIYHDTVWLKADRAKMNAAVFRALKPGGMYVVHRLQREARRGRERCPDAAPHRRADRSGRGARRRLQARRGEQRVAQPAGRS